LKFTVPKKAWQLWLNVDYRYEGKIMEV
jgi:hypothetical protein